MKTKTVEVFVIALALTVAAVLIGCAAPTAPPTQAPAPQVFKWRAQAMGEKGTFYYNMYRDYFELPLEAASGGRIDIDLFGRDELAPEAESFPATATGVIDLMWDAASWHVGTVAADSVDNGLSGGMRSAQDVLIFFDYLGYQDWKQKNVLDALGIKLICAYGEDPQWIQSKKPIRTIADLQGMKIRSPGMGQVLQPLGVSMVEMAGSEAYTAGMSGILDGATRGGHAEMRGSKLYEPFPYVLDPPILDFAICRVITGMDTWNKLPDDLKAILWDVSRIGGVRFATDFRLSDQKALVEMLAAGEIKEATELGPEDIAILQQAKMNMWDSVAAQSALDAKAVEMLRDFVKLMAY
jgi:TRAP-type C4-dicarboxylate transport system substrate-binding protein